MSGSERRALVVEHDKAIRQLIAAILKREQFEVSKRQMHVRRSRGSTAAGSC
jgi:DNA-binding response OmpR family regulator